MSSRRHIAWLVPPALVLSAMTILWIQSYWSECWALHDRENAVTWLVYRGRFLVMDDPLPERSYRWHSRLYLGYVEMNRRPDWRLIRFEAPVWPLSGLWAGLVIWGFFPSYRRWRRRRRGLCEDCGYMLRGLTTPRCPECGTAFHQEGHERTNR